MNDAAGARAAAQATAAAAPAGSPGAAAAATGDPPADAGAGPGAKPGADRHADAAWRALHAAASAPYRRVGRFAWHFARGKLGRDPVFRALLERGDLAGRRRIVDIGCGQGLLASLLRACGALRQAGGWPAAWPSAPAATAYTGIELMPRDVARAERALSTAAAAHAALRPLPPAEAVGRGATQRCRAACGEPAERSRPAGRDAHCK